MNDQEWLLLQKIHYVSSRACCLTNNANSNCLPRWPSTYELMFFFYWRHVIYHCFWCTIWLNVSVNHICNLALCVPKEYPLSHCFLMIRLKTVLIFFFFFKHELLSFCFPVSRLTFLLLADALKFNKSVACGNVWWLIVLEIVGLNLSSTFSRVNMELAWNLILQFCPNSPGIWLQLFLIAPCFSTRKCCSWYTSGHKHYCFLKIFLWFSNACFSTSLCAIFFFQSALQSL